MNTGIAPSTHKLTFPDHETKQLPMKTQEPTGRTLMEVVTKNIAAFPEKSVKEVSAEVDKTFNLPEGRSEKAYYNHRRNKKVTKQTPKKVTKQTPKVDNLPISKDELKFAMTFIKTTGSSDGLNEYIKGRRLGGVINKLSSLHLIQRQEFSFKGLDNKPVSISKWTTSSNFDLMKELVK